MNDEFLLRLQADWQSQDNAGDDVVRRLQRHRWTPHIVLGAEILVCALAFLAGLWFARVALYGGQHQLLFALSAAVMLLAAPVLCFAAVKARRPGLAWDVETPDSLLRVGMRRAESSLRAIRIGRWHVAVIVAFVITLWIVQALGFIHAIEFLTMYSAVCAVVCAVSWFWMNWRERRVRSENAACVALLAALQVDNGEDSGARE